MTTFDTTTAPVPFLVHHGEVDGVPAVWADLPGDPVLTLMFGVGHEDGTPASAGLTHLVEHLVMRRVGHVAVPHNAESTMRSTSFYAVGTPEQRADFLRRVCDAVTWLATITDGDLDLERRTILAEIGPSGIYAGRDAFSTRYGVAGPGLSAVVHARLMDWTAAEVRELAGQWLHRGNAFLTSTTPLPEGLTVPLPDGPAVTRTPAPAPLLAGRSWSDHDSTELVLSGVCSASRHETHRTIAGAVLGDVLHESLRTTLGHVYSVAPMAMQVADTDVWAYSLDPGPDAVSDVVVAALDVLERLAVHGPTPEELDRTRTTFLHQLDLSGMKADWLDMYASCALRGLRLPTLEEARVAAADVTTEVVRSLVSEFADTLLVSAPAGHDESESAVARLEAFGVEPVDLFPDPQGRTGWALAKAVVLDGDHGRVRSVLRGGNRFYKGKRFSPARGLQVAVLPDRLVVQPPHAVWTLPFADIVLVGTDRDGDVEVVTRRGGLVTLNPNLFRGLEKPFTAALERLPAGVTYRKDRTAGVALPPAT